LGRPLILENKRDLPRPEPALTAQATLSRRLHAPRVHPRHFATDDLTIQKQQRIQRPRGERCERTFAHVCDTGGGRRSWLRGQTNESKAHTLKCAANNLGLLLRKVWGMCKPQSAKAGAAGL
jgi:hypothetical protein